MSYLKALLVAAIWISLAPTVRAQKHNNAWFRGTLSIPIGSRIKVDTEFQHRRQNGFGNSNLLDRNLMFSFRNWIWWQYSENVKFSVSPFAFFSNYRIIQDQSDEVTLPTSEVRFSATVEMQYQLLKKFYMTDRTAVEYRIFTHIPQNVTRLRNRFGFRYDFTKTLKLGIYDELLLNATGLMHTHFFDHNRVAINLEYKISSNLKLDAGYIYIKRLPVTSDARLDENNFFLNLTYQLK